MPEQVPIKVYALTAAVHRFMFRNVFKTNNMQTNSSSNFLVIEAAPENKGYRGTEQEFSEVHPVEASQILTWSCPSSWHIIIGKSN